MNSPRLTAVLTSAGTPLCEGLSNTPDFHIDGVSPLSFRAGSIRVHFANVFGLRKSRKVNMSVSRPGTKSIAFQIDNQTEAKRAPLFYKKRQGLQ